MEKETPRAKYSGRKLLLGAVGAGSLLAASLAGCGQPEASETLLGNNEQFADNLRFLTNQERDGQGLPILEENNVLTNGAESYASFLARVNFPQSSLGTSAPSLAERLKENGFEPTTTTQIGETLIAGYRVSPGEMMDDWLNDPNSSEVILNRGFKSIGVGCFSKGFQIWCVQYFAGDSAH